MNEDVLRQKDAAAKGACEPNAMHESPEKISRRLEAVNHHVLQVNERGGQSHGFQRTAGNAQEVEERPCEGAKR